jgi:UDP-galactopyranose mutase
MKYDVLLVGAGLTSATIAAKLKDKRILILEKSDVGGMCRTENMNNIEVHMFGPHIFHTNNKEVWRFLEEFTEFNGYIHRAKSNVDGQILSFPINLSTYQQLYGTDNPSVAKGLIDENASEDFEDYLMGKIGHDLYDKFYKGYVEKFWGMPASNIPSFIAKRVPVRSSFNDLYFNDTFQGVPKYGYTDMINQMIEHCDIKMVDFMSDKEYYESLAPVVVYTGSVDEYFDYQLGELPYRSCEYYLSIEPVEDFQGIAQMNYPDEEIPYTRIIEHKHFNWVDSPVTITSEEHPRKWKRGGHLQRFYPIPLQDNMILYEDYCALEHKAIFAGRLGTYTYMNMDRCVEEAMELSEHIRHELDML